ncbi:DUF1194 domain-containing protein [Zavarzinia sp. CC-PAN008]|uniref:DUF1194 domain-containing protein n=1 Tax=Zavarzinia sp. CC-PAN008 TaxID=3243332 RepID=UPI003F746ED9
MRRLLALALLLLVPLCPAPAEATDVDLELVLALDSSSSVDDREFVMQRAGLAAAFADPRVLQAIQAGRRGVIAVLLMEWADPEKQLMIGDWRLLHDQASLLAFADEIGDRKRRILGGVTSISGAIDRARQECERNGFTAARRVIDVSGDGRNASGRPVQPARDAAVAAGFVINGLPIAVDDPGLTRYFEAEVIGGNGAFVQSTPDYEGFGEAMRTKLIREIEGTFVGAGIAPDALPDRAGQARWPAG